MKAVILAKAGIQTSAKILDSRLQGMTKQRVTHQEVDFEISSSHLKSIIITRRYGSNAINFYFGLTLPEICFDSV